MKAQRAAQGDDEEDAPDRSRLALQNDTGGTAG